MSHAAPVNPDWHEQVLGATHVPLPLQPLTHVGTLQVVPLQPWLHAQTPGAATTPFGPQLIGGMEQSTPLNPALHMHRPLPEIPSLHVPFPLHALFTPPGHSAQVGPNRPGAH
jgi:hypothetical protein